MFKIAFEAAKTKNWALYSCSLKKVSRTKLKKPRDVLDIVKSAIAKKSFDKKRKNFEAFSLSLTYEASKTAKLSLSSYFKGICCSFDPSIGQLLVLKPQQAEKNSEDASFVTETHRTILIATETFSAEIEKLSKSTDIQNLHTLMREKVQRLMNKKKRAPGFIVELHL